MLAAAIEGWAYPFPRTDAILMDQYDLSRAAAGDRKWKGYTRPFTQAGANEKHGDAAGRTPAQVTALLRPGAVEPPV